MAKRIPNAIAVPLPLYLGRLDTYAYRCEAWVAGEWTWDNPHPCPWRGRWMVGDYRLCGHHAKMEAIAKP